MVSVLKKKHDQLRLWDIKAKIRGENEKSPKMRWKTCFPNFQVCQSGSSICSWSFFNIIRDDLHLKPYKCHQWHKLEAHDYKERSISPIGSFRCQWILSIFFICSDEAYFYLTLPINKQSKLVWISRIWRNRNTFAWRESFSLVRDFC